MQPDFSPDPVSGSILELLIQSPLQAWVSVSDLQDAFYGEGVMVSDVKIHEQVDNLQSHGFVQKKVRTRSPVQVTTLVRLTREGAKVAQSLFDADE